MTVTGKNVYYDVLDDIVNEYNNTKHNNIKMKSEDVKNDTTMLLHVTKEYILMNIMKKIVDLK